MRLPSPFMPLILTSMILLGGCGQQSGNDAAQPNVVTNIVDEAPPDTDEPAPPANAIVPAEPIPTIETPKQAASPAGLIPASMQGRWAGVQARCDDRSDALELTIRPDQLIFHESVGMVQSIDPQGGREMQVKAAFTGEGESWTRTLSLKPSADGARLTIVNDGTAVTRKRC
ncbi:hypothetical protein [Sphingobium abikonense]|uniref:hypothetical protein n=1 Tax=Sphingobium abikonense TaxID=86193 RepID=UPI00351874B6